MNDELKTLAALPFHFAGRHPKPALMRRCRGDAVEELSTQELFDRIRDFSLGLGALGVEAGDRVAIVSDSRPEWVIADLAALTAGAVTAPIYPTLPEAQVRYILADSGARVVVVADEMQAAKVRAVWDELEHLSAMGIMDRAAGAAAGGESASGHEELSLAEAAERGHRRLMTEDGLGREYKERAHRHHTRTSWPRSSTRRAPPGSPRG